MSNDIPMSETVIYVSDEQSTNRGFKRLLAIGDFHCGHEVGLTPPQWNPVLGPDDRDHAYRETLYNYFSRFVDLLRPIDIVVANGDLIDGRGEKSGGTELLTPNRLHQINMAADILQGINAPSLYITRGTDYHVGNYESFENIIADKLPVQRIGDVINLRVNKTLFNFRHHIGGSQTPVGTATALTREMAWNDLWAAREGFPDADVVVRSHVHRALAVRDPVRDHRQHPVHRDHDSRRRSAGRQPGPCR